MSLRWPVAPMVARSAAELPAGDHWSYETKFDGFRCIALRHDSVQLQSRQLRPLTLAFPDVVEAVSALPPGTVVDGELVVMVDGRVDFSALQRRATSHRVEAPAMLAVFDLLAHRGEDLRPLPYQERRDRLEQLLGRRHPGLCLVPITRDRVGAAAWMRHGDRGIEGAVAKRRDQGYLPARNSWLKVRAKTTSEAVVGGVVGSPRRPAGLILGPARPAGPVWRCGTVAAAPAGTARSGRAATRSASGGTPVADCAARRPVRAARRRTGRVHPG